MRRTREVTLLIVLSGFTVIACSERVETAEKTRPHSSAPASAPTTTGKPSTLKHGDDEGASAKGSSAITGTRSFAEGEAAYHARKYSDATAIFENYTRQRPEHAMGHYMLGLSAWKSNDLAKAAKAFDAALAIDPLHLRTLVNLSRVLIDQKRLDEAVATLTRASEIEPAANEVHRLLGRSYYGQGKTIAAEEAYRRAIELDDRDVWSMNNLGLMLLEQQRADEALPLLSKAVELRNDVPAFHNNLGMAHEHTGHLEEALSAYRAALAVDPSYDRAKQNLARLDAVMGHY